MQLPRLERVRTVLLNAVASWLLVCVLGGCQERVTTVSGSVTLDGRPLTVGSDSRGTVIFQPANGQGSMATGVLDPAGHFHLATGGSREIAPGNYQVAVSVVRLLPKVEDTEQGTELITPVKYVTAYGSGLLAEVEPSTENRLNFDLASNADDDVAESSMVPDQTSDGAESEAQAVGASGDE